MFSKTYFNNNNFYLNQLVQIQPKFTLPRTFSIRSEVLVGPRDVLKSNKNKSKTLPKTEPLSMNYRIPSWNDIRTFNLAKECINQFELPRTHFYFKNSTTKLDFL